MKINLIILFFITSVQAQLFAPQVGFEGTKAIHKDSDFFIDWAESAIITRGYRNVANPLNGLADFGSSENAILKADGNSNIVSLGDKGEAILSFNFPIVDGDGADFAIFENGFLKDENSDLAFLELAFVEVSTNGVEYIRFPAISKIPSIEQVTSFGFIDARYVYNFAGKYINFYGTPFDLSELIPIAEATSVDLDNINFVKIIDVGGSINGAHASYDSENNIINDPYPTEFGSGGFDLDAIGVINNTENQYFKDDFVLFPNPVELNLIIRTSLKIDTIQVFSIDGKLLINRKNKTIDVSQLTSGVYIIMVQSNQKKKYKRFIKN